MIIWVQTSRYRTLNTKHIWKTVLIGQLKIFTLPTFAKNLQLLMREMSFYSMGFARLSSQTSELFYATTAKGQIFRCDCIVILYVQYKPILI